MKKKILRIGMIGTGRIAARFVDEIKYVEQKYQIGLQFVYNPHPQSAAYFADQHNIRYATDDLATFIDGVDAVYIATPHETHGNYIRKMLENGKHVLCEKPMTLSGAEARELFALAKERQLVLMEAVKTAYCPGFVALQELLNQGVIGCIHDVEACFTKIGSAAGREIWGDYAGSFLELGSYCMLPVARLLGTDAKATHIWSLQSVTGCDSYTKVIFENKIQCATVKTGLGVKSDGELMIAGEKGYIHIPSPWWMPKEIEVRHEDPSRVEIYEYPFEGGGLRYEIAAFANKIKGMEMCSNVKQEENEGEGKETAFLSEEESIWMAAQMEWFLQQKKEIIMSDQWGKNIKKPAIWAHGGCSAMYPENTLLSFEKAAQIKGIKGIELDVQMTKDDQLVVIHDERLDRTTTGAGYVKDYTFAQIRALAITPSGQGKPYESTGHLQVPALAEVFTLLKPYCEKNGLLINIELKNSRIAYKGMEKKVIAMAENYGISNYIVYSSFCHASMGLVKKLDKNAKTGLLSTNILDAIENQEQYHADALHPCNVGMAINRETVQYLKERNIPVRVWNGQEPLFGQVRPLGKCDLERYTLLGATDLFTNVPENYLE